MYEYSPKPSNNIAKQLSFFLFLAAIVLLGACAAIEMAYEGVVQIAAIVCLTFSVLILTRYVFKSYIYRVESGETGTIDLTVTEVQGKSRITVCRIAVSSISEAVMVTRENKKALRDRARNMKSFSYSPDISPAEECWLFVSEGTDELLIKLTPDQRLKEIFGAK